MKLSPRYFRTLLFSIALSAVANTHAQFEKSPVLNAQKVLRPEILSGKSYRVSNAVETVGFLNRYTIESEFGSLNALGNEQLIQRISEFEAIGMLREYKQSEEFGKTLEQTATGTVQQALNLVLNPGKSLSNIGSGASKTVIRARETLRRGLKKSGAEKEQSSLLLGVDKAKRDLANQLGVDPYSTNQLLQEELTRVATPIVLANLSVTAGTFFVPGSTALTAYKGVKQTSDLEKKIKSMAPIDLRKMNRERLDSLGVKKKVAKRFLDEAWLPPIDQANLIELISSFQSAMPDGKKALIARASDAANETDANFFARTFSLLARYELEEKTRFANLILVNGFPAGVTTGGKLVIPLDIDLLAWTPQIAAQILNFKAPSGSVLYLSGRATKLAKQQISAAGLVLLEDAIPGFYQQNWKP